MRRAFERVTGVNWWSRGRCLIGAPNEAYHFGASTPARKRRGARKCATAERRNPPTSPCRTRSGQNGFLEQGGRISALTWLVDTRGGSSALGSGITKLNSFRPLLDERESGCSHGNQRGSRFAAGLLFDGRAA